MTLFKSLVIICLIGCSLAAPKPNWDDVGRKFKEFSDKVQTKYNEVKEKILPVAKDACGLINNINQDPFREFQSRSYFPSNNRGQYPINGASYYPGSDFNIYYRRNIQHPYFYHHTVKTNINRPKPNWNFNPIYSHARPNIPSETTTEQITPKVNPNFIHNDFVPGFKPEAVLPTVISNSDGNTFNPVVNPSNPLIPSNIVPPSPGFTIEQEDLNRDNNIQPFYPSDSGINTVVNSKPSNADNPSNTVPLTPDFTDELNGQNGDKDIINFIPPSSDYDDDDSNEINNNEIVENQHPEIGYRNQY